MRDKLQGQSTVLLQLNNTWLLNKFFVTSCLHHSVL